MKCTAYETGTLTDYKYVVTFAVYNGKWIFCKHKERGTWEVSGGHIEPGETPLEAAKRELREETGALEFEIEPVCDYWACDEPHETQKITWANGAVFLARVNSIGNIPESEMEKIELFAEPPVNLTYPDITKELFPRVLSTLRRVDNFSEADLKFSEIIKMQKQLKEKHKDDWTPLTPGYGRSCLLWMVEELGEIVSVIKKRGETYIMNDPIIREAFIEEFADTLMFMTDAMICYGITASEFSEVYLKKHKRNMNRDWIKEEAGYIRRE